MGRSPTDYTPNPGDLPTFEIDPCSASSLEDNPPLDGRTDNDRISAVTGRHCGKGVAVSGLSPGTGVRGDGDERGVVGVSDNGFGVYASSKTCEAIRGETWSTNFAAIAGFSHSKTRRKDGAFSAGLWGSSRAGEGVHGETKSIFFSAMAAIQLNPGSTGAGIFAQHRGGGNAGFFDGNLVVTRETFLDGNVHMKTDCFLAGADCAEDFDVAGEIEVEPGTVMAIDAAGKLQPSEQAYDTNVAGIVSGAGSFRPALILDRRDERSRRVPIALVGKAYCKADAGFGPIGVGDLLTTAPTRGHAMKVADRDRAFGAILGKALGPLEEGVGLIPVLVALQ